MKLGEIVRIKNAVVDSKMMTTESRNYLDELNDNYGGALAMITRIVDSKVCMLDILPQCRSRVDTKNGWKTKDLLFTLTSIESVRDSLLMEVD